MSRHVVITSRVLAEIRCQVAGDSPQHLDTKREAGMTTPTAGRAASAHGSGTWTARRFAI
ncbi:hypothetical protein DMC63_28600 [Streptomyces sp. WAC 05977]|nr:hypothetical protein DMC63_28600 [Streptomyces sp. WAC 05977]